MVSHNYWMNTGVGYAVLRFKRFVCLLGGRMGSVTSYFQLSVMRLERGERLRRVGLVSRERSELTPFSVQTGVHGSERYNRTTVQSQRTRILSYRDVSERRDR